MRMRNRGHVPHKASPRPRRRGQHGMTLTELLVVMTVLAVIGGSIAGAFSIGLKILAPGGAQAQLTGSHDLISFEQQIGSDVAHAVCFAAPGQTAIPTGGCTASVQKAPSSTCSSGYQLCLAYYVPGVGSCHTITYSQVSGTDVVLRTDQTTGSVNRFTTGGLFVTASWSAFVTTNNGYTWTKQVVVAATQLGTPEAPTVRWAAATYHLVPLVADPKSPVSGGTSPC
jgi:prepilin-type N-terminal cleavage/methylation domain-containing protein